VRALWGLASWALPLAVVFAVTPFLLRALGAERFGVLMIISVTPLLAGQMEFGITSSAVRRLSAMLANSKVDLGRTFATLLAALASIGLVLGALVWLAATHLSELLGFSTVLGKTQGAELVRWCAVWVAVTLATSLPGILARSAQALAWITAIQTLSAATFWLSTLALVRSDRPLSDVVAVGIAISLTAAVATSIATRRLVEWGGTLRFDSALLIADARFSGGMFASQAASALVYQGDRILISAVGSPAIAGIYALCANVANKTLAAVVALTSFAFPHAAGLHAIGARDRLHALVHALDRGVIVIVMPLLLPGLLLAGPFFSLWLGEYGTSEVAGVFRILWVAFALPSFSVPVGSVLAAHGNAALPARFAWLTAAVVALAILVLVPSWGARGAAVAMLLAMSTSLMFSLVARRSIALPPAPGRRRFWRGIAVGLAVQLMLLMAGLQASIGWLQLLAAGAGAVGAFYFVRAIFGLLSPEEEQLLERLAARRRRANHL
jgi:O-antigen/teichoic acid export membrane protein